MGKGALVVIVVDVVVVAAEVGAEPAESSFAPLVIDVREVVLALPGDPAVLRSSKSEISTVAAGAGVTASSNAKGRRCGSIILSN